MTEKPLSCVEPVSTARADSGDGVGVATYSMREEAKMDVARVGKKAPNFTAQAYVEGGFKEVSLSDYSGKWVVLCFYPGDFTFV